MSFTNTHVLDKIANVISNIENLLPVFESLDAVNYEEESHSSSSIKEGINRTQNLYNWAQANGAFFNNNHGQCYTDGMARWLALIDNLHWALFGYEDNAPCTETIRLKIILMKLNNILDKLTILKPPSC